MFAAQLSVAGDAGVLNAAIQRAAHIYGVFPVFGVDAGFEGGQMRLVHRYQPPLLDAGMPSRAVAKMHRALKNSLLDVQFLLIRKQLHGSEVEPFAVANPEAEDQPVGNVDQAFVLDGPVGNRVGQTVIAAGDIRAGIMNVIRRSFGRRTTSREITVA